MELKIESSKFRKVCFYAGWPVVGMLSVWCVTWFIMEGIMCWNICKCLSYLSFTSSTEACLSQLPQPFNCLLSPPQFLDYVSYITFPNFSSQGIVYMLPLKNSSTKLSTSLPVLSPYLVFWTARTNDVWHLYKFTKILWQLIQMFFPRCTLWNMCDQRTLEPLAPIGLQSLGM
jgi:hypothetical protein